MQLRTVGARALLLEVDLPDEVRGWAAAVRALVEDGDLPAPDDVVPGARTLLLDGADLAEVAALCVRPGPVGLSPAVTPSSRL